MSQSVAIGEVSIDLEASTVSRDGELHPLSRFQRDLLALLIRNRGRVVKRRKIFDHVWGLDFHGHPRSLDQVIRRLRLKIETDPSNPRYLHTIHGVGYLLELPED